MRIGTSFKIKFTIWAVVCASIVDLLGIESAFGSSFSSPRPTTTNTTTNTTTTAIAGASRGPHAQWRLALQGRSFQTQGGAESAKIAGLRLDGRLSAELLPTLDLGAEAGLGLDSGQAQSRFGDQVPSSGASLSEALLTLRPFVGVSLAAGAVNQSHLDNPLLVSDRPFPGAIERVSVGSKRLGAELRAQQVIPTSVTLSTRTAQGEMTPSFMSETLTLNARPWEPLELSLDGSLFRFSRLPATVAIESELGGNTVNGDAGDAFHAFEFSGWSAGGKGYLRLARGVKVGVGASILQNTKAPTGYRNGQLVFAEAEIQLPGRVKLRPRGELFFNESDSAPASYNSSDLGHNNREGYAADVMLAFARERFRVGARFSDADLIVPSLYQERQQYILLRIETFYEAI